MFHIEGTRYEGVAVLRGRLDAVMEELYCALSGQDAEVIDDPGYENHDTVEQREEWLHVALEEAAEHMDTVVHDIKGLYQFRLNEEVLRTILFCLKERQNDLLEFCTGYPKEGAAYHEQQAVELIIGAIKHKMEALNG